MSTRLTILTAAFLFIVSAGLGAETARFKASIDFDDDNATAVSVKLSCNSGVPLEQSFPLSEDEVFLFVINDFLSASTDCELTSEVPAGYEIVSPPCFYPNVEDEDFEECLIEFARIEDSDGDGVLNSADLCPGTDLMNDTNPNTKKNRIWSSNDEYASFRFGDGRDTGIDIFDTGGCSASQIIERFGLGNGHSRFGISKSAIETYLESIK